MIWTDVEQVIEIHSAIIRKTGGLDGLRDRNALDAAIEAPLQTFFGQDLFASELEKIARLSVGLVMNHAFVDGNKRIGAMMMQLLLQWNGYWIRIRTGELADIMIAVASGTADDRDLKHWIEERLMQS